jgi:tetratricopeptide (TPR) repeat protein
MMDKQEELIIKYFEGSLTDAEKIVFEKLRATDPLFQDELEFQKMTKLAFQNQERKGLKEFLANLESNIATVEKSTVTSRPTVRKLWPYMAAAVVVLTFAATIFYKNTATPIENGPSLNFHTYYEPYPNVVAPITRGEAIDPEEVEKAAFLAYETRNFKEADRLFNQLKQQPKEYMPFYRGITKIELGQYDSAIAFFESYLYSEGMQFRDQAKWYLALSHLLKGDVVQGKEELLKLRKSSGYKMDEVDRLLMDMK